MRNRDSGRLKVEEHDGFCKGHDRESRKEREAEGGTLHRAILDTAFGEIRKNLEYRKEREAEGGT